MWKNIVEPKRPQMGICRTCIACWIPKATDIHSEYVRLTPFPLQQWLHKRASVLRCTYIVHSLSCYSPCIFSHRHKLWGVLSWKGRKIIVMWFSIYFEINWRFIAFVFTGTLWNMLIAGCKQQRVWLRVIKIMSVDQIGHFEVWLRPELWAERAVRASFRKPRVSCCSLSEDRLTKSLRAVLVYRNCALLSAATTSERIECVIWRSVLQPRSLAVQGWWFWYYAVKSPSVFKFITVVKINCVLFWNEMVLRQVVFSMNDICCSLMYNFIAYHTYMHAARFDPIMWP